MRPWLQFFAVKQQGPILMRGLSLTFPPPAMYIVLDSF